MNKSKKGVSLIVLILMLVIIVVVTIVTVNHLSKNEPFKNVEETKIVANVKEMQTKIDIIKTNVFITAGKEVSPENAKLDEMFSKINNTNYYKVNTRKKEFKKALEKGTYYINEKYEIIYLTEDGNIYPKTANISGMKIKENIPNGYIPIRTANELQNIKADGKYILMENIDLKDIEFKPIEDFAGVLDGNGMKILNLNYKANKIYKTLDEWKNDVYYVAIDKKLGLEKGSTKKQSKKYIAKSNTLLNTIYNDNVYRYEADKNIAAYDGYAMFKNTLKGSEIHNLTIENFSIVSNHIVAGLVGVLEGEISNITANNVNVYGLQRVGTIVGMTSANSLSAINTCIVNNEVKNNIEGTTFVGGIIGDATYVDIKNCNYNGIGSLIMGDMAVGGIAGSNVSGNIENCISQTQVVSLNGTYNNNNTWIGGIVGYMKDGNINSSHADVHIYSNLPKIKYAGGLAGSIINTSVENSSANGRMNNIDKYAGGLIGSADVTTGTSYINNCYANVDISALNDVISGFISTVRTSDITNKKKSVEISKSYSLGNINAGSAAAGFISWISGDVKIEDAYSKSNINVRQKNGGAFINEVVSKNASISNVYTSGYIAGENTAPCINKISKGVTIKNAYYPSTKDEKDFIGTPIKELVMNDKKSYKGFNFKDTWTTKGDKVSPEIIM
ncbi:MAG: hypothetical protein RR988_01825 [Clostridia bacterium]